jgi:hypothetical protein
MTKLGKTVLSCVGIATTAAGLFIVVEDGYRTEEAAKLKLYPEIVDFARRHSCVVAEWHHHMTWAYSVRIPLVPFVYREYSWDEDNDFKLETKVVVGKE